MPALRLICGAVLIAALPACAHVAAPQRTAVVSPPVPDYLVIVPDVSVSRSAELAETKEAALDEHADVMAEILSIPPGR